MAETYSQDGDLLDRRLDDEEVVSHSSVIDGTTLEAILQAEGKTLPPAVAQNLANYDYFVFDFKLGAKLPHQYKGVKSVEMNFEFVCDGIFDVEDGLPKAEWVASGLSGEIDVGIVFKAGLQFSQKKDLPTPAPTPAPPHAEPGPGSIGIDTGIRFKFSFAPEIETIRPSFAGRSCQLVMKAKPGKSVGVQAISLIAKLDKRVTSADFLIKEFRVVYRKDMVFTDTVVVRDMTLPVDLRKAR